MRLPLWRYSLLPQFLLAKPMRIAAKVSPIEAMRYQGLEKRGKKYGKAIRISMIFRLTKANMARNKKRTGITIVTLEQLVFCSWLWQLFYLARHRKKLQERILNLIIKLNWKHGVGTK